MPASEHQARQTLHVPLSAEVSGELHAIGTSIDPNMPHTEASLMAHDRLMNTGGLVEATRADLQAITDQASFAYIVTDPHASKDMDNGIRANVARTKALTFAHALGQLGTTPYEENGALLSLVTPKPGYEHTQSYGGSKDPLLFHQEMLPADGHTTREALTRFVILSGVSDTTPATPTMVSPIAESIADLSNRDRSILRQPLFRLRPYDAMKATGEEVVIGKPEPIMHEDGQVVIDFADIESDDPRAQATLKRFLTAANKHAVGVTLNPGETSIVDNQNAFHGRGVIPSGSGKRLMIRAHAVDATHPHAHKN